MTLSISTVGLSLTNFTASDLPTKKWMKLICPKMRLRVRTRDHDFVSSSVKVDDRSLDGTNLTSVHWPWSGERPLLTDDEDFEVEIQRRFLLRYKCIRRTKRVAIDQGHNGDTYQVPLYDGQISAEALEDRVEIGKITFTLQSDASKVDESSTSALTHAERLELHQE